MTVPYTMVAEVNDRYKNSIIFKDGQPIYVFGGSTENRNSGDRLNPSFDYCPLDIAQKRGKGNWPHEYTPIIDPTVTDGPFKLGYFNGVKAESSEGKVIEGAVYCARAPKRQYVQGLSPASIDFKSRTMTFGKAIMLPEFKDMLMGDYPTWKEATAALSKKIRLRAFRPRWAVGLSKLETANLFYRGSQVATGEDFGHLKFGPQYEFLKEAFQEVKAAK